jgi:hypothetical protein
VVGSGDAPVVSRGEGEDDGVLRDEINPMVTTAQSLASLVDVEVWPEMWAHRVMARSSICCELNQKKTSEGAPKREGGDRERRRCGVHHRRRNCPGKPADLRISVDEFCHPRFVPSGETKGREERGVRGLMGKGLNARGVTGGGVITGRFHFQEGEREIRGRRRC